MQKPVVFIGSSAETLPLVDRIEAELVNVAHVERWDLSTFRPSQQTLADLVRMARQCDFGIFVLGQDDATTSRGKIVDSPRDNVIFEAGLFSGQVGVERTFYVVNGKGTKLPSDWSGLTYTTYDPDAEGRRIVAGACVKIRGQMDSLGPKGANTLEARIAGSWWQFATNAQQGAAVSLFELRWDPRSSQLRLVDGLAWSADGKGVAEFRSQSMSVDASNSTLHYSWIGSHPREKDRPEFFGVGEITFRQDGTSIDLGRGHFSSASESDPTRSHRKSCSYRRAEDDRARTMRSGAPRGEYERILRELLDEWERESKR